ncbi:protein AKNAD1 [Candoia aspera]|uniref:protein AKNAD1 n=1 Tax=Candoia aspera TaxID=51853 RepID=UPI002FD7E1E4
MLYSEDSTDNEQEDLPYDGDLQDRDQYSCDSQNLEEFISIEHVSPSVSTLTPSLLSSHIKENSDCKIQLSQRKINMALLTKKNDIEFTMATEKEIQVGGFNSSERNEEFSSSKMSDVLLRHFPKEDLTCQLIDSETIPEISFTDSFDETVLNKTKISENTGIFSPKEEIKNIERKVNCNSVVKNWDLIQDKPSLMAKSDDNLVCNSKYCKVNNSQFVIQKEPAINEDLNYISTPKEEYQNQQYFLENTEYFHNPKYSEHQIYYGFYDSSEIAPEVKELKGNNESFVLKRTKSSPNLLYKDVLEAITFLESDTIKNQEEEKGTFELNQQLEMLTRQAEVQNHIDHLRFHPKIPPCSNSRTSEQAQNTGIASKMSVFSPVTIPVEHMLDFSQSLHSESQSQKITSSLVSADAVRQSSMNPPFLQNITDDKEQILKKQTEELKANVDIFSECIKQDVFSVEEHHQFLQLLKEQLEQLEQNYIATKEKHYALQVQNHKQSSRNIGEFDPNRKVEGEIFKLGMLLEDIKEKIEKRFSPYSSTDITSTSLKSHQSPACSSYSESPLITSISESPKRNVAGVNIPQNENYWKNRSYPIEVTPQKAYKKSIQDDSNHHFQQNHVGLQKKSICEKTVASVDKAGELTNKQSIHTEEFDHHHRPLKTNQNYNNEQENTDGNLNDWKIRSSALANSISQKSDVADFTVLKEQGRLAYSSDNYFLERVRHSTDEHNIIIHPRRKIQLSRNQICSCSSNRNKKMEYRKANRGNSDYERFSVFFEGKPVDLDVTDTSFCDLQDNSYSKVDLKHQIRSHGSWTVGPKELNKGSSQQNSIAHQRICKDKQREFFIDRLCDRQNLDIPQTRYSKMHDTIILSPQYLSGRNINGRQTISNRRKRQSEDTNTMILNSSLDHVIQTANNLKKTTEHMMQAVSEDLAKVKIQTLSSGTAHQY